MQKLGRRKGTEVPVTVSEGSMNVVMGLPEYSSPYWPVTLRHPERKADAIKIAVSRANRS
jgi:hypothetical protein